MDEHLTDRTRRRRRAIGVASAAGLLGVALLLALDAGYFAHGYAATWYANVEGRRERLTTTTEHRVELPNVHRPLARVVQGWPSPRLPLPARLPEIDVELAATLTVPDGRPHYLAADVEREAEIVADGRALGPEDALAPGAHALVVRWRAQPLPQGDSGRNRRSDSARFALLWGPAPYPARPVPASALVPDGAAWPAARVALYGLGLPLLLLVAYWLFRAADAARPLDRARRLGLLATAAVVALSVGYRAYDYDVMPEFRENADELFATWNGWSLLHDGTTRGWSLWAHDYHGLVEVEQVRFFGESRSVISPYFEHPPLLHVLVGVAAHAGGASHWLEAKLSHTRWVPILLAGLCTLLVMAITRRIEGAGPAPYLAGLLYATLPSIVLQTRVIKEEALLTVLVAGLVWFFQRWRDDGRRTRDLAMAAVCAGAATLTKVPAVVYVPALVMLVAAERGQLRRAGFALAVGLGVSALLPIFGAIVDWDAFVYSLGRQGGRPMHWNLFPRWFDATMINHNFLGRGWILFLWLGFAGAMVRRGVRDTAPVIVPLVAYMCAIAIGTGNWTFGWYIVPFYPLLCVGAGLFLARVWQRPDLLGGTLFVTLLVMYTLNFTLDVHYAKQPASWSGLRTIVTLFVVFGLAPYAAVQVWRESRLARGAAKLATALGLATVVGVSGWFVARYDTLYESHHSLDGDEYFTR
ncbi:MAG: glycosyltransferase family 39 protein [Sandaracinaceae bacterium]|nr:glycosyltransferase family 39 protein [Sandaracinaceae bacterium]